MPETHVSANVLGSENTCSERLGGVWVSWGELAEGQHPEGCSCGRQRPRRGSGGWRACHPPGLQPLQSLGPKGGPGGDGVGRAGALRGPQPETPGPLEGKPAETVLKVSEIQPLMRPSPALRCVSAAPGVAGEAGRGASRRLASIGCL